MSHLLKKFILPTVMIAIALGTISLPAWAADCDPAKGICFENPLSVNTPSELVNNVITAFLGLTGTIALIIFIIGGITWMTSEGEPEKIKKGLDTMIWAAIGLGIVFASYALVKFIVDAIV